MSTKRITTALAATLMSFSVWASDTAITQILLNVDPVYRLRLPDTIVLQNSPNTQQFQQVCVGISGVGVAGNASYNISLSSANYDGVNNTHRLSDGAATPNYVRYQIFWEQTDQELTNNTLSGLSIASANATQNYADIINDSNCTNPVSLLVDLNDSDMITASGSYSDSVTIVISGN